MHIEEYCNKPVVGTVFSQQHDLLAAWCQHKIDSRVREAQELVVRIVDPVRPSEQELQQIASVVANHNAVIYQLQDKRQLSEADMLEFNALLGLQRLDNNLCAEGTGVTHLEHKPVGQKKFYIPYSNKPLSWHTDGYYNTAENAIRAFCIHCVRGAEKGGENFLFDHELLYALLYQQDPQLVFALMRSDAMTIPPNDVEGDVLRGARSGPVFWFDEASGSLQMRYSARQRNIIWNDDAVVQQAKEAIRQMLSGGRYAIRYRLEAGQGIISNNILHGRTGFINSDADGEGGRLLLRARYFDRIQFSQLDQLS